MDLTKDKLFFISRVEKEVSRVPKNNRGVYLHIFPPFSFKGHAIDPNFRDKSAQPKPEVRGLG